MADPREPLGIRLNNPGLLEKTNIPWYGKVDGEHPRFEAFSSPEAGIRALARNIITKQRRDGVNTITALISAHAPANENPTDNYIAFVRKAVGSEEFDANDPEQLKKIVGAIIQFENGKNPYDQAIVEEAVRAAYMDSSALPTVGLAPPSGAGKRARPVQPFTAEEMREAEKSLPDAPAALEALRAAITTEWMLSWLERPGSFKPDPEFRMTPELVKELIKDLPNEYHNYIRDAVSLEHAQALRADALRYVEAERKLAALGWGGVALRLGAALVDPAAIAVGVATEGALAPYILANKVGRLGSIVRGALISGASNTVVESLIQAGRPAPSMADLSFAVVAGLGIGGIAGALRKLPKDVPVSGAVPPKALLEEAAEEPTLRVSETQVLPDTVSPELGDPDTRLEATPDTFEAYHGTPFSFKEFDLDKVLSRTTAAHYGYGVNLSTHRRTAELYAKIDERDRLSPDATPNTLLVEVRSNGKRLVDYGMPLTEQDAEAFKRAADALGFDGIDDIVERYQRYGLDLTPGTLYNELVTKRVDYLTARSGREDLMPEFRRDDLIAKGQTLDPDSPEYAKINEALFGRDAAFKAQAGKDVSKALYEAGILGFRHRPDEFDNAPAGAANLVIFSPEAVRIKKRQVGGTVFDELAAEAESDLVGKPGAEFEARSEMVESAGEEAGKAAGRRDSDEVGDILDEYDETDELSPEDEARLRREPARPEDGDWADEVEEADEAEDETAQAGEEGGPLDKLQFGPPPPRMRKPPIKADPNAPMTAFGRFRFDAVGQLKASRNPLARQLGALLGEDAVGNADRSRVNRLGTATEEQTLIQRMAEVAFYRGVEPEFRSWAESMGYRWWERGRHRSEFMEQVTEAILEPRAARSPHVAAAADAIRPIYQEYLELLRNPGLLDGTTRPAVAGADKIADNSRYSPRLYNQARLEEAVRTHGLATVERLFAVAIRNAQPNIELNVLKRIARSMVRTIRDAAFGIDTGKMLVLGSDTADEVADLLVKYGGLDPRDAETLVKNLTAPPKEPSPSPRLRRKAVLDENAVVSTPTGGELRFKDILVRDAETLFHHYNRWASGAVAFARAGFPSLSSFEKALKQVRLEAQAGIHKYTAADLARDIANLEYLATSVTGRPIGEYGQQLFRARNSRWGQYLRRLRDYNFIRLAGQFGFAQMQESANILAVTGLRATLRGVPAFRDLFRSARRGQFSVPLLREIEEIFGLGADDMRPLPFSRVEEIGTPVNPSEGALAAKVDLLLEAGKRTIGYLSLMTPVNRALYRWAYGAVIHRIADMATGGKRWSEARLASYGLDDATLKAIGEQIEKHSEFTKGKLTGVKVRKLNLMQWDDLQARHALMMAAFRIARRVVQENDPGNLHRWFSHPLGQMIIQFRTFMLAAHAKQFLSNLHARDINAAAAFFVGMVAGGLVYYGQTHLQATGRRDRAKFLRERLSAKAIALAAFQRAGWAALMPMAIDTVWMGDDPLFAYRTTQLSTGILGNPTYDMIDRLAGIKGVIRPTINTTYRQAQENWRLLAGLLPAQNALIIQNVINRLLGDLPKKSRRQ